MAVLFLLGFSGGMPSLLTSQTLQAWLSSIGVEPGRIASLNAVGLAYTLKVLWAPLLDRYRLPFLGRRRGWLLALQVASMVAIAAMGTIDPVASPTALFVAACVVAFISASQDVVIDAYSADILAPPERAAGSAMYVLGYRVAVLVTGTVALIMGDHLPWRLVYAAMAALMLVGVVGTLLATEPPAPVNVPRTFEDAIVLPIRDIGRRLGWRGALLITGFAALYRFGDYFAQAMIITFFKQGVGFSLTEIALVNKGLGFAGLAIGGMFAGGLVARFGLRRMLVAFGVMAAFTNLLYMWLALAGHSLPVFCIAIGFDNATTALGTAAFLSVLMSACSPAFSATQFALLTSLSSIGQRVFGPFAYDVVQTAGWAGFFATTAAMAIPGLVIAWRMFAPSPPDP